MAQNKTPVEVKFINPTGAKIVLLVGQGAAADRQYICDPGGEMYGPLNYTDFFERNGLVRVPDEQSSAGVEVSSVPAPKRRGQ